MKYDHQDATAIPNSVLDSLIGPVLLAKPPKGELSQWSFVCSLGFEGRTDCKLGNRSWMKKSCHLVHPRVWPLLWLAVFWCSVELCVRWKRKGGVDGFSPKSILGCRL